MTVKRLDPKCRKDWESNISAANDMPTFEQLGGFLENHIRTLEAIMLDSPKKTDITQPKVYLRLTDGVNTLGGSPFCHKKRHSIGFCRSFWKLTVAGRREFVEKSSLCLNCMGSSHIVKECPSSYKCRKCDRSHHTLLHIESSQSSSSVKSASSANKSASSANKSGSSSTKFVPSAPVQSGPSVSTTATAAGDQSQRQIAGTTVKSGGKPLRRW